MKEMLRTVVLSLVALFAGGTMVFAATIYATGQNNGDPSHSTGLHYYSIDSTTGHATPLASITGGNSAGLAGTPDGKLLGFRSNRVVEIDPVVGTATQVGNVVAGFSTTSLDATRDGQLYGTPVSGDRRLHRIDPAAGVATSVGPDNAIGNALDAFYGRPAGTSEPFIIGLGSITRNVNLGTNANPNFMLVDTLYGVNLDDTVQLVAINPSTGFASVVGALGSIESSLPAGNYSGFAAMTGVDTDDDGLRDTLLGQC
ncbi:MAG: hypothetical protein O2931_13030 [Planctomycetota bacterium]|nr:hypothetical protein [Planctomycetota bacterium]MDA1179707.1 hypothetical protein [Planctomycetota bacterium]